ncbi:MAG TPA: DUF2255 family protein [Acidimicrobiia bacterium]|nr:DUF2255 family protein [Acidimicrobiia bacterium]
MTLTADQIAILDESKEVRIETVGSRGAVSTIIWIVVAGDEVYIRSVRGDEGRWYQRALADPNVAIDVAGERIAFRAVPVDDSAGIDAVTEALRAKYRPGGSLDRMTRDEVLGTTLRLEPVS